MIASSKSSYVLAVALASVLCPSLSAQLGPEVTSWRTNLNGAKGSSTDQRIRNAVSNVLADVQRVQYNANYVYVSCTTVPSYDIGPFQRNPNLPGNTNSVFRVTRRPSRATSRTNTGLGPIGVFVNGVPAFNALDARSYFNLGIWNQNAYVVEGPSFDAALGHPAPGRGGVGLYHHHNMPKGALIQEGETWGKKHSPLIGFAFDGYPIYGPYGYVSTNGTGGIRRMRSSFSKRNITVRRVLPNGTNLPQNQWGPAVSSQYPLGYYAEDYGYSASTGDLDECNGRFTVTPEYPNGIYAYFTTIDSAGDPDYPYVVGPQYYGTPVSNRGIRVPGGVTTYREQIQFTGAGCEDLVLGASGQPTVPNSNFAVTLVDGRANGVAVILLGSGLLSTPLALPSSTCSIYLNVTGPTLALGIVRLSGQGSYSLGVPIPNNPSLVGVSADLQAAGSAGASTITTNAMTLLMR